MVRFFSPSPAALALPHFVLAWALLGQLAYGHGIAPEGPSDEARKIVFPDTEQYLTLVLDPHTHSVFSDGHVWPKIRVGEATRDGLDAMAITEHLEYQPHIEDMPHLDKNRSFEEAASAARYTDVMIIPGAEITRKAPASHMNALFIEDANKLFSVPDMEKRYTSNEFRDTAREWPAQEAVDAANAQGAFVFWNHSWWTTDFPDGIPVLSDFHEGNVKSGKLHGIEIANGKNYSEDAFQIALDHNLTLIGTSDVHDLIDWDYEPHAGGHRPVTLVFAKERSQDSLKEALFDRRTVVWFKNWLMGRERDLQPLLDACLSFSDAAYQDKEIMGVTIRNDSDVDFHLRSLSPYGLHRHASTFTVKQHSSERILVRTGKGAESLEMEFEVLNAYTAPDVTTRIKLSAEVE